MSNAVVAEALVKCFDTTRALDGLDLAVPEGTVLGLLGPNGAGKTTAVRVFSTLLRPDSGRAEVLGVDVTQHPQQVRRSIGLTGQFAAIDDYLTGRENLLLFGRLYHLGRAAAAKRADELLERFDLVDAAGRISGCRLELAVDAPP
jgi:ABC-2 type transport system ATP-binding protein